MFVVGLLLYFGETVFQNAGEETFTVHVKPLKGDIIKVSGCQGSEMLGVFIEKFEKAYAEKINDVDLKKRSYNLVYMGKSIVSESKPTVDKSLEDLKIGEGSTLYFVFKGRNIEEGSKASNPMETNEEKEYNITKENEDPSTSTCPCSRVCRLCGC
jgi:hypothetical protein